MMSLSEIIKRYLLVCLAIILVVGCIASFFIVKAFIHHTADNILYEYKDRIESYVKQNDTLMVFKSSAIHNQRLQDAVIKKNSEYFKGIKDTLLYDEASGSFHPYRRLYFTVTYGKRLHLVSLNEPTLAMDDLLLVVVSLLVLLFSLLVIFIYAISFYLRRKAWIPFGRTLNKLRTYQLGSGDVLNLPNSNIVEFNELNAVVNKMINKINADYENIKSFSEDISHEMQTPLAIVKSKVELLRQTPEMSLDSQKSLATIYKATSRLSKLSQSLLLLAKIKNNQYKDAETLNISTLLYNSLYELKELIEAKGIRLNSVITENIFLKMNLNLAEILVSNLLTNSIRHNIVGGFIDISLDAQGLKISNTCAEILDDNIDLFRRMGKNKSSESNGLGLNIVKSICDRYAFDIYYSYSDMNIFTINISFINKR